MAADAPVTTATTIPAGPAAAAGATTTPSGGAATTATSEAPPKTPGPAAPATTADDGGAAPAASPADEGGDEEGIRVPAAFGVGAGTVSPSEVTVPPFLRVELRLRSTDGAAHRVTLAADPAVTVDVPATGSVTRLIAGLSAGVHALSVDGRADVGRVRAADDAGP